MEEKDHITINQIADEAKVSIATVSRVLNGNATVSPERKKRVEEVIKKYNFSPNALARGLISRQTKTIGVVLPDISNPYFSSMFLEIERSALEAGYTLLLCNTLFGGSSHGIRNTKEESYYFQMLTDKQVDGVLIIGGQVDLTTVDDNYKQALKRLSSQLPVVVIGKELEDINCIFIHPENGQGNEELIALSDYYTGDGYSAINTLVSRNTSFTAFLAINDNVALGAERALLDLSIKVPEDVAVISCDQFLTGEYHIPRLTSINQHHDLLARLVINTLISAIKGNSSSPKFSLTPELVIRESCGTHMGIR
ncbi:MAG: LacI family transcriptional regulator [Herbinix sp.]|nr:LacI family transcriptional regulator [Herbinix sp.]